MYWTRARSRTSSRPGAAMTSSATTRSSNWATGRAARQCSAPRSAPRASTSAGSSTARSPRPRANSHRPAPEKAGEQPGALLAGGLEPLVPRRQAAGAPRGQHALAVRVAPPLGVALRRDQHVLAHGVQLVSAQRAAVGRRLAVLSAAQRPPVGLGESVSARHVAHGTMQRQPGSPHGLRGRRRADPKNLIWLAPAEGATSIKRHEAAVDVAIVGAGVIGLALGWRLAQRGVDVVVLDRGQPGSGASRAAAGMLAAA